MIESAQGIGITPLSGQGAAVWVDADIELPEAARHAESPTAERERLAQATRAARAELESLKQRTAARHGADIAAVFDAQLQFLNDPTIESALEEAILEHAAAPEAVLDAFGQHIELFEGFDGPVSGRADDLRDVRDCLLRDLFDEGPKATVDIPTRSILLADRLTPIEIASFDPRKVAGFATVLGSPSSHVAGFARAMAVPAVIGVGPRLHQIDGGADLVVDAAADTCRLADGDDGDAVPANPDVTPAGATVDVRIPTHR